MLAAALPRAATLLATTLLTATLLAAALLAAALLTATLLAAALFVSNLVALFHIIPSCLTMSVDAERRTIRILPIMEQGMRSSRASVKRKLPARTAAITMPFRDSLKVGSIAKTGG